jgi:hypothetical protein
MARQSGAGRKGEGGRGGGGGVQAVSPAVSPARLRSRQRPYGVRTHRSAQLRALVDRRVLNLADVVAHDALACSGIHVVC